MMCNLTISSILQKPNKTECTVKRLESIKMHLKWSQNSRYGGRKCIYLHIGKITQSAVFFFKNKHFYSRYWFDLVAAQMSCYSNALIKCKNLTQNIMHTFRKMAF